MLPKFSIVSIGAHTEVLDWVKKFKPVSLILVNERGQASPEKPWTNNEIDLIRDAMGTSPQTLWIIRSWPDGIGEGDLPLNYRVHKCFMPFWDLPSPKMGHSFNEPGFPWIGSSGDARRLEAMETGFAKYMHDVGLLSMNFCFSESHILKGNMGLWNIYADALPYVDALGFNEYDWPWEFASRDQGYKWRIGHWEYQVARLRKLLRDNYAIPPVIIGEGILDGKIWTNALPEGDPMRGKPYGWRKAWPPANYVVRHQSVYDDTYHKPGAFSHHTFCYCHPSSEWRSYSVKPILDELGKLIKNQVYWADSQNGPNDEGGESVDSPLATWREGVSLGNYTMGPTEKNKIVLHSTDGTFTRAVNWFLNPSSRVSAHYVIGRGHAGEPKIYQMVKEVDIAHHAGNWDMNTKSIGIECADDKLTYLTDGQERRLVDLLRDIVRRHPHIGRSDIILHRDVVATECPQAIDDEERNEIVAEVFGEPASDILEGIARIKAKAEGMKYLAKQIEEEADAIEEML